MSTVLTEYVQASSRGWLTVLSGQFARLLLRERYLADCLAKQVRISSGQKVLDLGCRTVRLAMQLKKAEPGADVIGIAGDRDVAETARAQARGQGINIPFFDAPAFDLPCRDSYFDRVYGSMLFHHLTTKDKILTAKEICRILKPGGELYVADFGRPQNALMELIARIMRNSEEMNDNVQGLLPHILFAADLEQIETMAEFMTIFGTITVLRAKKPR